MNHHDRQIQAHAWRRILIGEGDEPDQARWEALRIAHLQAVGAGYTRSEIDQAELAIRRAHLTEDGREHLVDVGRLFIADQCAGQSR